MSEITVPARIVAGHKVASGQGGDPRFPDGTLRMQIPLFKERGLDLSPYYPGTLNLSISPWQYEVASPKLTFRQIKWCPTEPAEDFSFFDCEIRPAKQKEYVAGLIYFPHPETKPEHFQPPDVLEVLAPPLSDLTYGEVLDLRVDVNQLRFVTP